MYSKVRETKVRQTNMGLDALHTFCKISQVLVYSNTTDFQIKLLTFIFHFLLSEIN